MADLVEGELGASRRGRSKAGADRLLSLAAAPTFAMMALITGIHGGGMPDMLCAAAGHGWPLSGMVPMYVLMTAFHLRPWLRLAAGRVVRQS